MHSTWGTFEWLLHDAFEQGFRVGVVCHSDDHKGRPGATRPGASTFGAIGGLTCYFMPELTRDALFEALRQRRTMARPAPASFSTCVARSRGRSPAFPTTRSWALRRNFRCAKRMMGDIIRPGSVADEASAEVIGTAPVERLDVLHGTQVVQTVRPLRAADLGRRVRVLWQGAEYRGRGRETIWQGKLTLSGNRIARFARGEFSQSRTQGAGDGPGPRSPGLR